MVPAELDLDAAVRRKEALASAGAALAKAGYSERSLCAWFATPIVTDVRYLPPPPERSRRGVGAAFALLVAGEMVERRTLGFLDDAQLDALVATGLVARHGGVLRARVSLVPIQGVLIAADRFDDGSDAAVGSPDLSALNVAASLPRPGSLLHVGCGAGPLAPGA